MPAIHLCPICGHDRNDRDALRNAKALAQTHGLLGESVGPGGRALRFAWGSVHLGDQCGWCDWQQLQQELTGTDVPNRRPRCPPTSS